MSKIPNIPAQSSIPSQPSLTSLKSQLSLYQQYANASGPAANDYKALQLAIQTNNIADAQAALARLRRDSQSSGQPASSTSNASAPVDTDGDHDGSSSGVSGVKGNTLNTTA
jgi:hypothetical protein